MEGLDHGIGAVTLGLRGEGLNQPPDYQADSGENDQQEPRALGLQPPIGSSVNSVTRRLETYDTPKEDRPNPVHPPSQKSRAQTGNNTNRNCQEHPPSEVVEVDVGKKPAYTITESHRRTCGPTVLLFSILERHHKLSWDQPALSNTKRLFKKKSTKILREL
jgi:hypothetical protein